MNVTARPRGHLGLFTLQRRGGGDEGIETEGPDNVVNSSDGDPQQQNYILTCITSINAMDATAT